jgi:hypothetical protein
VLYQLSYIPTRFGELEDCTCRAGHLSKQMSKLQIAAILTLVLTLPLAASPARAERPVQVAVNRCNGQTIDDASARVREYDRHPPSGSSAQLLQRYGAIAEVIATLGEERDILNSICSSDAQRAPLFAEIAETAAWALVLEADVAARLNPACTVAATALPTMMLADAWLALANVVNDDGGAVPATFGNVIPKVQTRAQAVGLALPAWPETSAYWRDQVHAKAKAAVETCPSPSPSPTPPVLRQA